MDSNDSWVLEMLYQCANSFNSDSSTDGHTLQDPEESSLLNAAISAIWKAASFARLPPCSGSLLPCLHGSWQCFNKGGSWWWSSIQGRETSQDGHRSVPSSDKWAPRMLWEDDAGPGLPAAAHFSGTDFIPTGERPPNEFFLIKTSWTLLIKIFGTCWQWNFPCMVLLGAT